VNLDLADPTYIYSYLKLNENYVKSFAQGSVTKTITKDAVRNLEIVLPPLHVQKSIAQEYETFSKRIDILQKENFVLEEILQNRYKRIVQRRSSGDLRLGKFGELANPRRGKTITKKKVIQGVVPVVAGGVKPAYFHNESNVIGPVITISASGTAGYVNFYYENIWASDCSFISSKETDQLYFSLSFLKDNQSKLYQLSHGAVQKHLGPKDLSNLEAMIPKESDLNEFEEVASKIHEKIHMNLQKVNVATDLRDRLINSSIGKLSSPDNLTSSQTGIA